MPITRNFAATDIHRILDQLVDPDCTVAFYCQLLNLANGGLQKPMDPTSKADLQVIRNIAEARLTALLILERWDLSNLTAPSHSDDPEQ